jgi:hypothetical protein
VLVHTGSFLCIHGSRNIAVLSSAVVDLNGDDVDEISRRIAAACDGPLNLVIDPLCGLPAEAALRVLTPWGRLVNAQQFCDLLLKA